MSAKPVELHSYIHASVPYGSGSFKELFINVYDADLWTDAPHWSWDTVFALALNYHLDIDGKEISDKSVELIDALQPLSDTETDNYTKQLSKIFPDIKDGDEITALYIPKDALYFYRNGKPIGTIHDLTFARRLLSIWFSERTSTPDLRRQLLSLPAS